MPLLQAPFIMFHWTSSRIKRVFVISSVMVILICFIAFLAIRGSSALPFTSSNIIRESCAAFAGENEELRMVHMVLRHGQRTPADTYPNDIYVNKTFYPYGWGQLTNLGKQTLFDIGKWARKRYGHLIGDVYQSKIMHAQSTGVTRAQMSLAVVLAGLWEPHKTPLEWNPLLNWQPIPYTYENLDEDTLLLVRVPCPRYHEEIDRILNEVVTTVIQKNKGLFEQLTNITGLNITTPDDVQSLYSTLKSEQEFGLKLPEWAQEYYPHKLQELTDFSYILNVYNDELKKFKGGPFLKKTLKEWKDVSANNTKDLKKIYIYVGHDSSVVNVLSAFNVWQPQYPDYGTMAIFELYENTKTGVFTVQILQKRRLQNPEVLTIPGCEKLCPLNSLETLLSNHIPGNLTSECRANDSNYTVPPLSGP